MTTHFSCRPLCAIALVLSSCLLRADEPQSVSLSEIDSRVLSGDRTQWRSMVRDDLNRRMARVNEQSRVASLKIETRNEWEAFSRPKLEALQASLGDWPQPPKAVRSRVTRVFDGDGYRVENVVFETRPGLWVTANLYSPAKPTESMPGIVICHSHHRPKEQGELQDMGMTWARAGCVVFVPDHLGHGERRQHPFATADDYAKEFRVSRQDYYFRYDTGIQLHLVGESLIGWMAWDLMRGVDLVLSRKGVDPKRIILLGAVAGGGDPAAVTAALDKRIACAVPFNFGGPQPETRYPLPEDSETSFNYAGGGGWESTRNLRRSAADGFLPYVIVGGIAPRRLVFSHEFNWHRERDPVWKRLKKIYSLYDASDNLAFTHGRGELKGRPPEATHCTNIGPFHRRLIHQAFQKWFGIGVTPDTEYSNRRETSQLRCMTESAAKAVNPKLLVDLLPDVAARRLAAARTARAKLPPEQQREKLKSELGRVLGNVEAAAGKAESAKSTVVIQADAPLTLALYRASLVTDPGITIPMLILQPAKTAGKDAHVVIGLAQAGKQGFLQHRSKEILKLLQHGHSVCLPDLRGTGETRPNGDRGRYSTDTGRSSTELMLGGTTVGTRLRDLRSVMAYLSKKGALHAGSFTLWGDSFAAPNPPDRNFNIPRRVDGRPKQSEPLGGMLALLGALYEDDVTSVYVRGGLTRFVSVLTHQQVLIPHDTVVPGLLSVADFDDIAAALTPRRVLLTDMVDNLNRTVSTKDAAAAYSYAADSYKKSSVPDRFTISKSNAVRDSSEWIHNLIE